MWWRVFINGVEADAIAAGSYRDACKAAKALYRVTADCIGPFKAESI